MVATTRMAFGRGRIPVVPRDWFLVPLFVIDEAVNQIKDGDNYRLPARSWDSILNARGRIKLSEWNRQTFESYQCLLFPDLL